MSTCDIIWTCLEDEKAVCEVFAEILKHDLGGKLFVECSTILPHAMCQLAQRIQDGDAKLVAMPGSSYRWAPRNALKNILMTAVFGEPSMARKGLLVCVPAGPKSCVERIRPYLIDV